jgi:hypothetical protein
MDRAAHPDFKILDFKILGLKILGLKILGSGARNRLHLAQGRVSDEFPLHRVRAGSGRGRSPAL